MTVGRGVTAVRGRARPLAGLAERAAGLAGAGDPVRVMVPWAFVRALPLPGATPIIEGVGPAFGAAAAG